MLGTKLEMGSSDKTSYTVEHRGNCVLVYGAVPVSAFSALTKMVPRKAVMATHLAQIAGCNLAMGLPDDAKALAAELAPGAIAKAYRQYAGTGLSEAAIRWLAVGERGASSDAMFLRLTGIRPLNMNGEIAAHPHDPSDLGRCRLLLEQVSELSALLPDMANLSPIWARIVVGWDDLCEVMDTESPQWREGKVRAERTYELLQIAEAGE